MAKDGKIVEEKIIDKKVYQIGQKFGDSLKPANKAVEEFERQWLDSVKNIKQSAISYNKISKEFGNVKTNSKFIQTKQKELQLTEQTTSAYKEQERAEKNLITTIERKKLATESTVKALTKERYELQQLNKRAKEAAILSSSLSTEYEKKAVRLTQLQRKYKEVALTQGYTSKEAKRLKAEITPLDATLKKVNAHVGQFQRSVGNYGKAMGAASKAARTMMSAMGAVGGAYLFVNVMRDAFNRVREFDKSMQNLAGVFRTTRTEIAPLEADIISVAGSSIKTSNEVAKLAGTLATLGKTPEQIQKLLKATVDLGIGLETTGEEAGEFLIQMLNAFGASDDEALKYADTIATIRTSTTLDFQKMRDSFQYIAPISKILNKDLAYTGAVVGILADNSLKAEQAGRLLGTAQQKLAKEGKSLTDALDEINEAKANGVKETDLLAIASDLFGAQAAKVGVILADNTDKIEANAQAIRDNGGALDDLVNEQLKSLDAKLKILDSSWEELILTIENGEGSISQAYKGFIETITFAIQKTTELQKAQSEVFKTLGHGESGWRSFFNLIIPGLSSLESSYDKIVDKQKEFNRYNENIENESIEILTSKYKSLQEEINNNNNASIDQRKIYQNQISLIENVISKKKEEEKALRKQAKALGYAGEMYKSTGELVTKYDIGIDNASISDLKRFVELKKAENKETNNNNNSNKKANELLEKRLKLLADDKLNYQKTFLESEIEAEKQVRENEENSYTERILANTTYYNAKKQLLELQKAHEIKENEGRTDKLAEIELKYEDALLALKEEKKNDTLALLQKKLDAELKLIQDAKQAQIDAENADLSDAQGKFQQAVNDNPNNYEAQLAAKEVYEKEKADIEKKYRLARIQAQIDEVERLQQKYKDDAEFQEKLTKQLTELNIQYSNIETDAIIDNLDKQAEAEEERLEKLAELKSQIFDNFSSGLGEALGIDSSGLNDFFTSFSDSIESIKEINESLEDSALTSEERFRLGAEKIAASLEVVSAAAEVTRDIIASVYEANISELQAQLDATNEYYDNAYERAEGDQVQQDLIREEQRQKELELNKQIAKEKTKAAKADKTAALIQAGINTALAITSALTQAPPAGYIMAALSAAMGIAQIAIIASKPIPKFKEGHLSGTYEGWAITNDGGRDEVWERDGKAKVIKGRNVPIYMKKGDKIHRSVEESPLSLNDYNEMYRAAMLSSIEINNNKLKAYEAERAFLNNEKALREEMALTRKAIEKNKTRVIVNQTKPIDIGHQLYRLKSLE